MNCNNFVPVRNGHLRRLPSFVPLLECVSRSSSSACSSALPPSSSRRFRAARAAARRPRSSAPSWARTPGVLNPAVTQATIRATICTRGWTRTVRPPVSYTNALKVRQLRQYGLRGPPSAFQEDHLISLELGGNPTDPRNLWPEPYPRAAAGRPDRERAQRPRLHRVAHARRGAAPGVVAQARLGLREHGEDAGATGVHRYRDSASVMRASRPRSCSRSRPAERPDRGLEGGRRARLALVDQAAAGRCELDPHRPAVGRVGLARDEAEVVQDVDGAARRRGARPDPRRRGRSAAAGRRRRSRSTRSAGSRSSPALRQRRRSCGSVLAAASRAVRGSPSCPPWCSCSHNSCISQ